MSLLILNAEPQGFNVAAAAKLREIGEYVEIDCDRSRLLQEVARADILIVRLRNRIDREVLVRASRLKMIGTATTGLNHIDQEEVSRRNVRIVSLRGETEFLSSITATAELTWALLLNLVRHLSFAQDHVRTGGWDRDLFVGRELRGKSIGIVGYGRLGRMVAAYARAFRMNVMAHDRDLVAPSQAVEQVDLQTLLARSDVVSMHLSYEVANARFFGKDEFSRMKQGAIFINTARGEMVDEDALTDALESGHLSGAALDVLDTEGEPQGDWLRSRRLWAYARNHTNLLLTPHLGGACIDSMHETESFLVQKMLAALMEARGSDGDGAG